MRFSVTATRPPVASPPALIHVRPPKNHTASPSSGPRVMGAMVGWVTDLSSSWMGGLSRFHPPPPPRVRDHPRPRGYPPPAPAMGDDRSVATRWSPDRLLD